MWTHPGKKLLFMGSEFGQWNEWNERTALQWELLDYPSHSGVLKLVSDLNKLYQTDPAMHEVDYSWEGFQWLELRDVENSTLVFLRRGKNPDNELLIGCNFTPVLRYNYRVGVPKPGFYTEVLNTDAEIYWGSNVGNNGGIWTENIAWGEYPYSLSLTLPPLGTVILRSPTPQTSEA